MKKITVLIFACTMFVLANAQTINADESKVEFKIAAMGLASVKGEIGGMQGSVFFDKNNLNTSSFDVTINPKTINTQNDKRDKHLQEEDFFDVDNYLTIHFKSTSILKNNDGYLAKGKLTILDTTKEIDLPFRVTQNKEKMVFYGEIEINRFDYNLASEEYKSSFMVGETATVKITCVVQ